MEIFVKKTDFLYRNLRISNLQHNSLNQNARIGHLTKKSVGDDKKDKNAWSQKPLLWAMKEVRVNTVYANYYAIWTFFRRLFQTEYIVGIKSICRASILFT